MNLLAMLFRKGIFSSLDLDNTDVNAHNVGEVMLWRKVLDEMLIAYVGSDTSARDHSEKWFNSSKGDEDWFIADSSDTGNIEGQEYRVDMYEEFAECCRLANLEPDIVRNAANRAKDIIEKERKEKK